MPIDHSAIEPTLVAARERLLAARTPRGYWEGRLSSSALSTATAVGALELIDHAERRTDNHPPSSGEAYPGADVPTLIRRGLVWIAEHQNDDGGWGDTEDSPSNLSTTVLCWAALGINEDLASVHQEAVKRAQSWLAVRAGDLDAPHLARAIDAVYGRDRTFSVPILTMCALAGRLGKGREAWRRVPALPFELAACPHRWFRRLGLPVVSYALPALIAIGQARHHHRPTRNPVTRGLRHLTRERTLGVLQSIQPQGGGFLEAAPLTSFVVMSLLSIGRADHPVAKRGAAFLIGSVREDGSWPIDTNLATWLTTLSVTALAGQGRLALLLPDQERAALRTWLLRQQHTLEHPYTHADPGGWAWTDLSGGVPDTDDTAGALLALWHLADKNESRRPIDEGICHAAQCGIRWLLDLQNADGGIPTFCRGWGKLPFDRSSPDLTAHALRAWSVWREHIPDDLRRRVPRATSAAIRYLTRTQRDEGAWVPLWFGSQKARRQENPLYGTSRVLRAAQVGDLSAPLADAWSEALCRGVKWLLRSQNPDGGWGGAASVPSSIEETALAVEALADQASDSASTAIDAIRRGCAWLVEHTEGGTRFDPAPIGLYFAKLWYFEELYPLIYTVSALHQVSLLGHGARTNTCRS